MPLVTEQLKSKAIPFEILFHQPTFYARDDAHRVGLPLSDVVRPKQRFGSASLAMSSGALPPLASALDIPIYADPEVMAHDMIVFAASKTESLRVRADQVLGSEVTIVPLVQGQATPEYAAVAKAGELRSGR